MCLLMFLLNYIKNIVHEQKYILYYKKLLLELVRSHLINFEHVFYLTNLFKFQSHLHTLKYFTITTFKEPTKQYMCQYIYQVQFDPYNSLFYSTKYDLSKENN